MKGTRLLAFLVCLPALESAAAGHGQGVVTSYVPEPRTTLWDVAGTAVHPLLRSEWSGAWEMVPTSRPKEVGGTAPRGWFDASHWAAGKLALGPGSEDGLAFLHVQCAEVDYGEARLGLPLGAVVAGNAYRITVRARGAASLPLRVAIAARAAGGPPAWEETLPLAAAWKTATFVWNASASVPDAVLFVSIERKGAFDLAEAAIDAIDIAGLRAAVEASPALSGRNDLDATRFPFGLPVGWMLPRTDSDGDEVKAFADRSLAGPSGAPPLRVEAPAGTTLYGAPFVVSRFWEPQAASFAAKGDGTGFLAVTAGGHILARKAFSLDPAKGWQRVTLPFRMATFTDPARVEIELHGSGWIDALRSGCGENPGAYETRLPGEVDLGSADPARVAFDDDPGAARVSWAVYGAVPGAVLRAKAIDLYREQIVLPPVPLDGSSPAEGAWDLPVFAAHPLGPVRMEAWMEDAAGRRLSPYAEWVVYRLKRPRCWDRDAPDSPFGVHILAANRELEMAKAIGINWVRTHDAGISYVGWYFLEPAKGDWRFDDAPLQRYRARHLMILGQLETAPAWASGLQRAGPRDPYSDRYYAPDHVEEFQDYVRQVAGRYRDVIGTWEVWNEPWSGHFWKIEAAGAPSPSPTAPADYARLMRAASETAKQVDPSLRIVGFNSTAGSFARPGSFTGEAWTRAVAQAGGLSAADVFSYHDYVTEAVGYPGDAVEKGYRNAVGPLLKQGVAPLPVWMTEGSPVAGLTGPGFYYHSLPEPSSEDVDAVSDRLCRYVVAALGQGDRKVFLYSMHKYGHFDNGEAYRLLVGEDGYLHPSAAAFSALAWRIEGKTFQRAADLTPDTRAYLFRGDDGWTAVCVPRPGTTSTLALPSSPAASAADLYGNPLRHPGMALFYLSGSSSEELPAVLANLNSNPP